MLKTRTSSTLSGTRIFIVSPLLGGFRGLGKWVVVGINGASILFIEVINLPTESP